MKRKILFFIIIMLFANYNCSALNYADCSYSQISRLKAFVSNINISYDYYISDNKAYFNLTFNNIVPDIYFVDYYSKKTYNYFDTNDGEITLYNYDNFKGSIDFYSSLEQCYGVKLGTKYYKFPQYNIYYEDPLCEQNRNFSLCQKWQNVTYSYSEFKNKMEEYNKITENGQIEKENQIEYKKGVLDKFIEFYTKYYYILLSGIIVVCIAIMITSNKKNRFDI